ncbi:hemicentin-2 isoform X1 [Hydra vulgaris]|uniref:hemicentin-2 isoform X1 n=1 Tax=Hydra vulgaris TaxID=6087 RepID=UPI001F5EA174|nr:hemicentin-2 [Hydra vulgaris]
MYKLLILCYCILRIFSLQFYSNPASEVYAIIGNNVYLSWQYNTEEIIRVKYGILDESNFFTKILVSVTNGKLVQNFPDKAVLVNDIFILKNVSVLDIGVYQCEVMYANETIFSNTKLTVVDITLVNNTVSNPTPIEFTPVSLCSIVAGNIFPELKWYLGNIRVTNGVSTTLIESRNESMTIAFKLVIDKVEKRFQNIELRLELPGIPEQKLTSFTLMVKYSPSNSTLFFKNVTSNIISDGLSVTLVCTSETYPPSTYTIKHNFNVISNSSSGILNIVSFSFQDEGVYECIPSNEIGVGAERKIELFYGVAPVFLNESKTINVDAGKSVDLYFVFISNPNASYQLYFKNNELNSLNSSYYVTMQSIFSKAKYTSFVKISIRNLLPENYGNFSCKAKNVMGEKVSAIFLNVSYPLQFPNNLNLKNTTINVGAIFSLECNAIVNPGYIDFAWLKNDEPFKNKSLLAFYNATLEDAGMYTCVATDGVQSISRTIYLGVAYSPFIYSYSKDQTLTVGETAKLFCFARGYPQPIVQWYKIGVFRALLTGQNITIDASVSGSFTYICVCKNVVGENRVEITIKVVEKVVKYKNTWIVPVFVTTILAILILIVFFIILRYSKWCTYSEKTLDTQTLNNSRNKSLILNPMYAEEARSYPVFQPNYTHSSVHQTLGIDTFNSRKSWDRHSGIMNIYDVEDLAQDTFQDATDCDLIPILSNSKMINDNDIFFESKLIINQGFESDPNEWIDQNIFTDSLHVETLDQKSPESNLDSTRNISYESSDSFKDISDRGFDSTRKISEISSNSIQKTTNSNLEFTRKVSDSNLDFLQKTLDSDSNSFKKVLSDKESTISKIISTDIINPLDKIENKDVRVRFSSFVEEIGNISEKEEDYNEHDFDTFQEIEDEFNQLDSDKKIDINEELNMDEEFNINEEFNIDEVEKFVDDLFDFK